MSPRNPTSGTFLGKCLYIPRYYHKCPYPKIEYLQFSVDIHSSDMLSFSHSRELPIPEKEKAFEHERATHAFRSDTRRLGHRQKDPAYLSRIQCVHFRFGRSDGDGGTDNLQRDESYRSRPAPASTVGLFRCTRYLDDVRRDRGCIETDTTPDRRRPFPTKFLPQLNLSLGAGTQNDH